MGDFRLVHLPEGEAVSNLLTVAEVAERFRVSKMTVYRLIHGGDLPALQVGRSLRVRIEDLMQYEQDQRTGAASDT